MTKYASMINRGGATIDSPDKTKQKLGATMLNDETPNIGQGDSPMMSEKNKAIVGNGMDTPTDQAENKISGGTSIAGLNYRGSLVENRNNNAFISSMAET